jgi:hypothetical protein
MASNPLFYQLLLIALVLLCLLVHVGLPDNPPCVPKMLYDKSEHCSLPEDIAAEGNGGKDVQKGVDIHRIL